MKKGYCEMVFILDRSGSMHGLESDTIGGFNSMIKKQRRDGVRGTVTAALFDDRLEVPFDHSDISTVPDMTNRIYFTRGCTALYDAVGSMIMRVENRRWKMREDEIPEKTVFVITTDGYENSSVEFSGEKVRKLIQQKEKTGWEFLYLGANIDAAAEAGRIGIRATHAARFHADSEGIAKNFEVLSETVSCFARCSEKTIPDAWADTIREDYRTRRTSRR
ncbi:MAG: VWA domain-containing protein [Anaerolineaceae bacterium]|nr:VWA domain-containing protein [Anaerolineaceae bacterium]